MAQMQVFARPRRSPDALPPELDDLRPDTADLTAAARALPEQSRLLLSGGRSRTLRLFAVPTSDGNVCWQITEALEASCTEAGRFGISVLEQGGSGRCLPVHVVGIVPDRVRAVEVVVSGTRRRARLGTNGFLYELDAQESQDAVTAVVFRLRDGSSFRKALS